MKILRDKAKSNQDQVFNYNESKRQIEEETFVRGQIEPLRMHLDVLESFFEPETVIDKKKKHLGKSRAISGSSLRAH